MLRGCEVGHLTVDQAVRLLEAIPAARVALEGRQELVIDVVEDRSRARLGVALVDIPVAVVLDEGLLDEMLVRLLEADDRLGAGPLQARKQFLKVVAEDGGLPEARAGRVVVVGAVARREVAADDLVDLDHISAALHELL